MQVASEAGFAVRGVEFSGEAIAAASDDIRAMIVQGNVNELASLNLGTYDVVTAFDIIEHSSDPFRFLTDIGTVLKPNGLLVISTPDTGHYLRLLMGRRGRCFSPFSIPSYFHANPPDPTAKIRVPRHRARCRAEGIDAGLLDRAAQPA